MPTNEFNQIIGIELSNWSKRARPSHTTLQGHYCSLEPLDIDKHSKALFDALLIDNNGESWTYLPYGPFSVFEDFKEWLKLTKSDKDTLLYAITDTKNIPVGISGYLRINEEHGVVEVGHLHYSKLLQRTPAATEAMYLMMHYVFETLKYRRYEWKCNSLNQASHNAALRLGFKFEGIFRQSNVYKNRNRDTTWFSIINNEWPVLNEQFKKWLDSSNFDKSGNQKNKLNAFR